MTWCFLLTTPSTTIPFGHLPSSQAIVCRQYIFASSPQEVFYFPCTLQLPYWHPCVNHFRRIRAVPSVSFFLIIPQLLESYLICTLDSESPITRPRLNFGVIGETRADWYPENSFCLKGEKSISYLFDIPRAPHHIQEVLHHFNHWTLTSWADYLKGIRIRESSVPPHINISVIAYDPPQTSINDTLGFH